MGFIGNQPTPVPLTSSDITDGIISTAKIANDAVDNTKLDLTANYAFTGTVSGAGKLKNLVYVAINPITPSGGSAEIPIDNTLPLIGEGQQVIQHDYTPVSSSSTIFVHAYFIIAESTNARNSHQSALFFNDACVNARAFFANPSGEGGMAHMSLQATFSNSSTSALDIEIRVSQSSTANTINGQSLNAGAGNFTVGSSSFGGANATNCTYMTITEF